MGDDDQTIDLGFGASVVRAMVGGLSAEEAYERFEDIYRAVIPRGFESETRIQVREWRHPQYGTGGRFRPDQWLPAELGVMYVLGPREVLAPFSKSAVLLVSERTLRLRIGSLVRLIAQGTSSGGEPLEVRGIVRLDTQNRVGYVPSIELPAMTVGWQP